MLLNDKSGIICDFCGITYRDQFTYYSVTTILNKVINGMRVSRAPDKFNTDCCVGCYESMREKCMQFIGSFKHKTVKCDFSDQYLSGTFDYYVLNFDKVDVDKELAEDQQTSVEKQVLDFNLSEAEFLKLKNQVDAINRKYSKEQWS